MIARTQPRHPAMLDLHFVRENLDAVMENCRRRNVTVDFEALRPAPRQTTASPF